MLNKPFPSGFSLWELRLARYNWNTSRLFGELGRYTEGVKDPVDAVLHTGAAAVHVITGIGDAMLGDTIRLFKGPEGRAAAPLQPYTGDIPRLKLDASEAWGATKEIFTSQHGFRGRIGAALTLPVIGLKTFGDTIADVADGGAGIKR